MIGGRKIISLCIARLHDIENYRFIARLNEQLKQQNCSLLIYNLSTDLFWDVTKNKAEVAVFELIDFERTDAVIIMDEKIKSHTVVKSIISNSKKHDIPVLVVDGKYEGCTSIEFNYRTGFEKIVRHVIEYHGVKDIRFIGGFKGNHFSDEREEIVRRVAEENNVPFDDSMVYYGEFWANPAELCAERIIASGKIPEAVICANDVMAINVSSVFAAHGIKVPEDVIITGFDGIDEIYFTSPKITSAKTSYETLADTTFSAVMSVMAGEKIDDTLYVDSEIIISESCGCGANVDSAVTLKSLNNHFYHYQDVNVMLNNISDEIQTKYDLTSAAEVLNSPATQDMYCIINKECTDNTRDYFTASRSAPFSDTMFLFYDHSKKTQTQSEMSRCEMLPGLLEKLESGSPLIFNCIYFMSVPIGYICFCFKGYDIIEYGKIMSVANAMGRGIGGLINMRYQRYLMERVEKTYMFDYLTGLYTRTSFNKKYSETISELPFGTKLTLVLSDLDGLKEINDNYGHFSGDNAISTVANALKKACPPDSICVRYGGDEMISFITGPCNGDDIIKKFRAALDEHNRATNEEFEVSSSVGIISDVFSDETDINDLIRRADKLMYIDKYAKKNQKS